MNRCALGLLLAVTALVATPYCQAADDAVWSVAEAAQQVGKQGTVELVVKSSRLLDSGKFGFLNSEKDFQQKSNFTIAISAAGLEKFKTGGIADPATHFRDKTIHVSGKIVLFKERAQIQVDDPKQIVVIEKLVAPKK